MDARGALRPGWQVSPTKIEENDISVRRSHRQIGKTTARLCWSRLHRPTIRSRTYSDDDGGPTSVEEESDLRGFSCSAWLALGGSTVGGLPW